MKTASQPAPGKPATDLSDLNDPELWQMMHADPPDKLAEEEFLKRCMKKTSAMVNAYVFAEHFCPASESSEGFASEVIGRVHEKLAGCLESLRSPEKVNGWLRKVTRTTAIDLYRKNRRGKGPPPQPEPEDLLETEKGIEHAWLPGSFRSRYWRDPSEFVRVRENVELLDVVLAMHAQRSKRDADSALWIKTKLEDDLSVDEIAARRGTTKDDVWHLFTHDQRELLHILVNDLKLAIKDL
jgi:DNA-directed RNA polymerase specialized sigma24 family protein